MAGDYFQGWHVSCYPASGDSGVPAKPRLGEKSEFNEIAQVDTPVSISHA